MKDRIRQKPGAAEIDRRRALECMFSRSRSIVTGPSHRPSVELELLKQGASFDSWSRSGGIGQEQDQIHQMKRGCGKCFISCRECREEEERVAAILDQDAYGPLKSKTRDLRKGADENWKEIEE
jgi:hypothetical protein